MRLCYNNTLNDEGVIIFQGVWYGAVYVSHNPFWWPVTTNSKWSSPKLIKGLYLSQNRNSGGRMLLASFSCLKNLKAEISRILDSVASAPHLLFLYSPKSCWTFSHLVDLPRYTSKPEPVFLEAPARVLHINPCGHSWLQWKLGSVVFYLDRLLSWIK